jgi:hypothetical protein
MEILDTIYNLMGLVFVLGTIISMGLSLTMKQITHLPADYVYHFCVWHEVRKYARRTPPFWLLRQLVGDVDDRSGYNFVYEKKRLAIKEAYHGKFST